MMLMNGTQMNASSLISTFHADTRADFRQMLRSLRELYRPNRLHIHEQLFTDDNIGTHTLIDCEQANNSNLELSKPRLFQGTFIENDKLWIAWGFVAFEWDQN